MTRKGGVRLFAANGNQFVRWIKKFEAYNLVNEGTVDPADPANVGLAVKIFRGEKERGQARTLHKLAIEKYPKMAIGGLTRTETKPRILKFLSKNAQKQL